MVRKTRFTAKRLFQGAETEEAAGLSPKVVQVGKPISSMFSFGNLNLNSKI